mgnify:CR=1 FL=1
MNNLVTHNFFDSGFDRNAGSNRISFVLTSISKVLGYRSLEEAKIKGQLEIALRTIEVNANTREDIMKTIRELGKAGQLTPELAQYLFTAYNQVLMLHS